MAKPLRLLAWAALAVIVFATLSPIGLRPRLPMLPVDMERMLAFLGTGYLFALAYPRNIWLAVAIMMAGVFGFEILQHLGPDRHGQFHDALVKAAGASIGLGFGWITADIFARRTT